MQEEISFGIWLRKQRRALDLTRQAFADQVGCAEVTLRRIEVGTLKPSKELVGIILETLGIPQSQRSQWISFARGLSGFPIQSPLSSNKPKSNLPVSLTSFVGREKEQAQVINLISNNRLVTFTGSGGVGKTRFARKVGEQLVGNYPDGVWLVELASLNDPTLLPKTVATLFGLVMQQDISHIDLLITFLHTRSALIILDNCEHLVDACAHLADTLLKNCPKLKILVTSREPLETTGEALYRVPSLGLPDLQYQLDTLRDCESVKLFEERAQRIQFDFSLTPENASSVVQICHHLDGIPLAIELAAAKVGVFSIAQIAEQLEESLNLLTGRSRAILPRHQTLRASMNWSWNLLTEAEQRLMRQLAVFAGGWTLEAAQSVCDGDVLILLPSLVTKSLVVMNQKTENNARYSFHETIRQYAREKLFKAGGSEAIRDRHLAYFVKLAEQVEPELYRSNQIFWLNKLDGELDNTRTALEWAVATDIKSGLQLIIHSTTFWEVHGDIREEANWLKQLLEHYQEAEPLRAQALAIYSMALAARGELTDAHKIANQSLELAHKISDKPSEALSLWSLGGIVTLHGDLKRGIPIMEQSLAVYEALGDRLGQANVTEWLGNKTNDLERSKAYIIESLRLYRELGHLYGIAVCLSDMAQRMIWEGNFAEPVSWLQEARANYHQLGNQAGEAWVLNIFGALAYWSGDYQGAVDYLEEGLALNERDSNFVIDALWSRVNIGYAVLRQGKIDYARTLFRFCIKGFHGGDSMIGLVYAIEGLASLTVSEGQFERAARLFAWADTMREQIGDRRPPIEQASVEKDLTVVHSALKVEYTSLSSEGHTMTVEQAVGYALESSAGH